MKKLFYYIEYVYLKLFIWNFDILFYTLPGQKKKSLFDLVEWIILFKSFKALERNNILRNKVYDKFLDADIFTHDNPLQNVMAIVFY
jgi:hypothetical protein